MDDCKPAMNCWKWMDRGWSEWHKRGRNKNALWSMPFQFCLLLMCLECNKNSKMQSLPKNSLYVWGLYLICFLFFTVCINSVRCFSAAGVMSQTGQFVTLKVAKQSAIYYGLATQLGQQSPPPAVSNPPFQSTTWLIFKIKFVIFWRAKLIYIKRKLYM